MQEISILSLVLNASSVVQLVMLGLLLVSIVSWALIFNKTLLMRATQKETLAFEDKFWSGGDLAQLYDAVRRQEGIQGLPAIFAAGFSEFAKQRNRSGAQLGDIMDGSRRAMRAAAQRELARLENHNAFLATAGSVSPYVGLFGTVWGIMHAFIGLGQVGQATLATVAPGIAEALVATAIGLFAAIPAVIAYNRFASETDRFASQFDMFMEEFSNILQRLATK